MDNGATGGNETFVRGAEQGRSISMAPEKQIAQEGGRVRLETRQGIGNAVGQAEGLVRETRGAAEWANGAAQEIGGAGQRVENIGLAQEVENMEMGQEIQLPGAEIAEFPGLTETRPLAEDGSTEGKINRGKRLSFDGEVMDKESAREVEKEIRKYEQDPFELDNIRNKMMTESLRDNYGRIFGDNANGDGGNNGVGGSGGGGSISGNGGIGGNRGAEINIGVSDMGGGVI